MTITKEESNHYVGLVDYLISTFPHEKIHTIFEMSIDMGDEDWDLRETNQNWEEEYGDLFDHYTKNISRIGRYFNK